MNNKTNKKPNININFQTKNEKVMKLFNCTKCGFHAKVISKIFIKDHEENCLVRLLEMHPQYHKVAEVLEDNLKTDGEVVEELICGFCGKLGGKKPISVEMLKIYGLDPDMPIIDGEIIEEKQKFGKIKNIFKTIKNKLNKIKEALINEVY